MAKKSTLNVRISLEIKHMIKTLYSSFDITITDAINIFLHQSILVCGLPLNLKQPRYNSATKAAIIGFTKALAKEVSLSGITVNAVAPGVIHTDMCNFDEETLEGLKEEIPLGRIGKVNDVSGVVKFLLSDAASYITGQVINVSGGFVM